MKNETIDAAVLTAVQAGVGFRRDIVSRLVNCGLLMEVPNLHTNNRIVENSLQRLKDAKKIHYPNQVEGWKVLS